MDKEGESSEQSLVIAVKLAHAWGSARAIAENWAKYGVEEVTRKAREKLLGSHPSLLDLVECDALAEHIGGIHITSTRRSRL